MDTCYSSATVPGTTVPVLGSSLNIHNNIDTGTVSCIVSCTVSCIILEQTDLDWMHAAKVDFLICRAGKKERLSKMMRSSNRVVYLE